MKASLDCLPCLTRQAVELARVATSDQEEQERLARRFLREISQMDWSSSAPAMAGQLHALAKPLLPEEEVEDPYLQAKEVFNRLALEIYPEARRRVQESDNPFQTAVRLSAVGNTIDLAVNQSLTAEDVECEMEKALDLTLVGDIDQFKAEIAQASSILFIADNAGEIVFDKLLLELMPRERIVAAVRGCPILNDATIEDAEVAGLTDLVEVIDTGSGVPGILYEECGEEFRERFEAADLVIAKGQGNFETLAGEGKAVWFIFRAKCDVTARQVGARVGDLVVYRYVPGGSSAG
jgi:uncharacterized protein with ATP-grasp and redox domains